MFLYVLSVMVLLESVNWFCFLSTILLFFLIWIYVGYFWKMHRCIVCIVMPFAYILGLLKTIFVNILLSFIVKSRFSFYEKPFNSAINISFNPKINFELSFSDIIDFLFWLISSLAKALVIWWSLRNCQPVCNQ